MSFDFADPARSRKELLRGAQSPDLLGHSGGDELIQ